ncbi:MAG TPA: hypothetical protein VFM18_18870 [Methanosarcina sp.]|nr:hypothetical protein [Methanosarcina sp.]
MYNRFQWETEGWVELIPHPLKDGKPADWAKLSTWCGNNCTGKTDMDWSIGTGWVRRIKFELESDMVLFRLVWM